MSKQKETIYEPHPVSAKRKAELVARGYQIIDAVFAPAGYAHPDAAPKAKPGKGKAAEASE